MAAATTAPEFGTGNGDDLDPRSAQQGIGIDVAVVSDDDARLEGDHVVAVVPLLALGLIRVPAGGNDPQAIEPESILHYCEKAIGFGGDLDSGVILAWPQRERPYSVDDRWLDSHEVAVTERKDSIEMHE